MRINWILGWADLFGGYAVATRLINEMQHRGHRVTIYLIRPQPHSDRWQAEIVVCESRIQEVRRRLVSLACKKNGYAGQAGQLAGESIQAKLRPADVSVAQLASYIPAIFRAGQPAMNHMQHFEPLIYDFENPVIARLAREALFLPCYRTANCSWAADQLRQYSGQAAPLIFPGIDTSVLKPQPELRSGRLRVLCMSKNIIWKGFQDAMEAVRLARERGFDFDFCVFGHRPETFVKVTTPIQYLGNSLPLIELARIYSSASILLSASWFESFPLPPIEAMACGLAVITTKAGTEDYAKNEETALTVESRRPQEMAEALIRLLTNDRLRERLSVNGVEMAGQFPWSRTFDLFEQHLGRAAQAAVPSSAGASN